MDCLLGFTGRPRDAATGLQNNLHRGYDAETGRWMSKDPIGFEGKDGNTYRYVGNRVPDLRDPSGLGFWSDYWHYLWHPSEMDTDLRVAQGVALGVAGTATGALVAIPVATGVGAAVGANATATGIAGGIAGGYVGGKAGGAVGGFNGNELGGQIGAIGGSLAGGITGGQAAALRPSAASATPGVAPKVPQGWGNIGSHGPVSPDVALGSAQKWLGAGYKEIAPGVYRSADGLRQFRMASGDLLPTHGSIGQHVHFEALNSAGEVIENLHIPVTP